MKHSQAIPFLLASLFAASAFAQQGQGMVSVDLGTVADTMAKNIKVEVDKIPPSVKVPVGIAATACGVPAAKLAPAAGSDMASCQATGTSPALEQVVQKEMKGATKQ